MPPLTLLAELRGRNGSEAIDSLDMIIDVPIGKMMQRISQAAHRAIDDDFFMGFSSTPSGPVAAKQTDIIIRVPSASFPPPILSKTSDGAQDTPSIARRRASMLDKSPFVARA